MIGEKINGNTQTIATTIKRVGRRNLIICASVLILATAICINWALFANMNPVDDPIDDTQGTNGDPIDNTDEVASYFAAAQITRQQTRDSALEVLQMLIDSEGILEEERASAIANAMKIADEMQYEANIETIIKSKGFEDCIAVISNGSVNIIVKTPGLSQSEVAQIFEVVYQQANIEPANVTIKEKY